MVTVSLQPPFVLNVKGRRNCLTVNEGSDEVDCSVFLNGKVVSTSSRRHTYRGESLHTGDSLLSTVPSHFPAFSPANAARRSAASVPFAPRSSEKGTGGLGVSRSFEAVEKVH